MNSSGTRKRWILFGLAATTLATVLWAAYIFTAIWLRVGCARELAPVLLWDAETRASQTGNVTVNLTASSGAVSSGQVLAKLVVWEPTADFQMSDQNGSLVQKVAGPSAVCIVQDGELKMIRTIPSPSAPANDSEATESPKED